MGRKERTVSFLPLFISLLSRTQLATAALDELNYSYEDSASELDRLQQRVPVYVPEDNTVHPEICAGCNEYHSQVQCSACKRGWHTLCLDPPVLKKQNFEEGDMWRCPWCKMQNTVSREEMIQDKKFKGVIGRLETRAAEVVIG